jgi:diguanylate cyclase (GGDEF)-like protein
MSSLGMLRQVPPPAKAFSRKLWDEEWEKAQKPLVLLADDDDAFLSRAAHFFEGRGHEVRVAWDFKQALNIIHNTIHKDQSLRMAILLDPNQPAGTFILNYVETSVWHRVVTHVVTNDPDRDFIEEKQRKEQGRLAKKKILDKNRSMRRSLISGGAYEVHDKKTVSLLNLSIQITFSPIWKKLELVVLDDLVGLKNYKGFTASVEPQLQMMQDHRSFSVASLLMIDANKFKEINDQLGHIKGDEALRTIATALQRKVRRSDLVARKSGDEFMVWLPNFTLKQAEEKARELIDEVAQADFRGEGDASWPLSISAGAAEITPDGIVGDSEHALVDLINRADAELYKHKESRR